MRDEPRPGRGETVEGNGHPVPSSTEGGDGAPVRPGLDGPPPRAARLRRWLPLALVLLAAAGLAVVLGPRLLASLRAPAATGLLLASGRIEGRITTLTPKSSARVAALHVDEGEEVRAGQLLATLDDPAQRQRVTAARENLGTIQQRLRAANAEIAMTERQVAVRIEQAQAAVREAEARVARAAAAHEQALRDAQRAAILVAKELIAEQEAEHARLRADLEAQAVREAEQALARTRKELEQAHLGEEQLAVMRASRDALESQRRQAAAQLAEQQSLVADFTIRSPMDGRVLARTVEVGERVDAGTPLFALVDLDQLYVKIYVPEPRIGEVALGQEARVYVDAYPGRPFAARVSRVSQEAEFTPKNVETPEERAKLVFAVEVALAENPGGVLKPGMPADAVLRLTPDAPWAEPSVLRGGVVAPGGARPGR